MGFEGVDAFFLGALAAALTIGFFLGYATRARRADIDELRSRRLIEETERRRQMETEALLDGVKLAFSDIGQDLMRRGADQAASIAGQRLDAERRVDGERRALQDADLEHRTRAVLGQLDKLFELVREVEKERGRSMGQLSAEIQQAGLDARALKDATRSLEAILANRSARGQWGERMADDLLRAIGLQEGLHYVRQRQTEGGERPDYTFFLGDGLALHMDVKFPLDNLMRAREADEPARKKRLEAAFARDVRARIDEVAKRGYAQDGGVGVALALAPNERLAQTLFERDPELIDHGLAQGVILCSPTTLFAVLAVLRAAAARFRLDRDAARAARALRDFTEAWRAFERDAEALAKRLAAAQKLAASLAGPRSAKVGEAIDALTALDQLTPPKADDKN